MKKIGLLTLSTLLIIASLITLSSCSLGKPSTQYEKVKYAFNGVEKSFKKASRANNKKVLRKASLLMDDGKDDPLVISSYNNPLDIIYGYYTSDDIRGTSLDELSYNEPPMIQFQYLKKVLEKIGKNYSFGTKYYYDVKGVMYMDIETGLEAKEEKAEYKYDYVFNFAIYIDIDDEDLITAYVTFDITLTQGNNTYNTKWYVGFILDYDMNSSNPTYTLTELNQNSEGELPFRNLGYVYEYDYVEVKNNDIKEWRKFCYEINTELIKDSNHQTFDDYRNMEGFEYKVDYMPWFKDSKFYKYTQMNGDKKIGIANALYAFGLNSTDINGKEFFAKEGVENDTIKTIYNEVCNIFGKDVIYDIVCRDDDALDDHGNDERKEATQIMVMSYDLISYFEGLSVGDNFSIKNIFTSLIDYETGKDYSARMYYASDDGELLDQIYDYDNLTYKVYVINNRNQQFDLGYIDVSADATFDQILAKFAREHPSSVEYFGDQIKVEIIGNNNATGSFIITYTGDLSQFKGQSFPEELRNLGIVEYKSMYDVTYDYTSNNESKRLIITGSNEMEAKDYLNSLIGNGFTENVKANMNNSSVHEYYRPKGNTLLVVRFIYSKDVYILEAYEANPEEYYKLLEDNSNEGEGGNNTGENDNTQGNNNDNESNNETMRLSIIGTINNWDLEGWFNFVSEDGLFNISVPLDQDTQFVFVFDKNLDEGLIGYTILSNHLPEKYFAGTGDKFDSIYVMQSVILNMQLYISREEGVTIYKVSVN